MTDLIALAERAETDAVVVAPLGSRSGTGRWQAANTLRECAAALRAIAEKDEA